MAKPTPENSVTLMGRLAGARERPLPSGDTLVSFRVVVDRPPQGRGPSGRVRVDALECTAYRADVRRRALALPEGSVVEVVGSLRRRFWRSGAGPASIIEVEAVALRRITETGVPR